MQARLVVIACSGFMFLAVSAQGNPYDDCILQNVQNAQNETAVSAIERACISKSSVPLPDNILKEVGSGNYANVGNFNAGFGLEYGIVITFTNNTSYDITELAVLIQKKSTGKVSRYLVDAFYEPQAPGSLFSTLGEPEFNHIIKSGRRKTFFTRIDETAKTTSDFSKEFDWDLILTKGIPAFN